jgi:hypothetical protein
MTMPRYHFVVYAPDQKQDDPHGLILPGPLAAKEYGHRVVRELKEGGYHPPGATLHVLDETGKTIHSIPF